MVAGLASWAAIPQDQSVVPEPLPVDAVLPELLEALRTHGSAVLVAPTGAGKTTRVPPALLDAGIADRAAGGRGSVVMLEPRRIAARAAAVRMSRERGGVGKSGGVGGEIGYRVRFDAAVSAATRIEVVTGGLFLRRLQDDPFLEGVGAVVFDEFHERSLDTDLAFAMVQRVRAELDEALPLVVMSATLDVDPIAAALGGCPIVRCEGRTHPVDVRYLPPGVADRREPELVELGVRNLLDDTDGDILVFLPGLGEIRRAGQALTELAAQRGLVVQELYGDLPSDKQDAVLAPGGPRKIVLATNVAETSVTIPGVTGVVDTGTARVPVHDMAAGIDRLERVPISRAAADQRTGRAGRTAPGVCARLWTEAEHGNRPAHETPELQRVDLAGPLLQLLVWGERDPRSLPWLEAPAEAAVVRGLGLLESLGALADGVPTSTGRQLARLPVHPRIGGLLVAGAACGLESRAALAAALLSERDPFAVRRGEAPERSESDVLDRVRRLEAAGRGRDAGRARAVLRVAHQLERLARGLGGRRGVRGSTAAGETRSADEAFLRLLVTALPDRVARRRESGSSRGVMVGGRGVQLADTCAVRDAPLFLCLELAAGAGSSRAEAMVRLASKVEVEWLPQEDLTQGVETLFDEATGRVTARRRRHFRDLLIEDAPAKLPDAATVSAALAEAASTRLAQALPLDDPAVAGLSMRLAFLAEHMPEQDMPALDDDALRSLLPRLCGGKRSFAELRRVPLAGELANLLDHRQRRALEEHAPERLTVPSGSTHALRYEPGTAPVLAVRIQELFGWTETPRLAGGRVPVLLHLLAPNHRPQQITDDLANFWRETYTHVRKDLRARYPKHAWPEDPATATAERGPKRRR